MAFALAKKYLGNDTLKGVPCRQLKEVTVKKLSLVVIASVMVVFGLAACFPLGLDPFSDDQGFKRAQVIGRQMAARSVIITKYFSENELDVAVSCTCRIEEKVCSCEATQVARVMVEGKDYARSSTMTFLCELKENSINRIMSCVLRKEIPYNKR